MPDFNVFFRGFLRSFRVESTEENTLYIDEPVLLISFDAGAKETFRLLFPVVLLGKRSCL